MKNILVFPCGSEIALELYRSLNNSTIFKLIGASSVDDHGKFVYENYIGDIPYYNDSKFISTMKNIVEKYDIDFIYPAMDAVITTLKQNEHLLGCYVVSSPVQTTEICLSKELTYNKLDGVLDIPKIYDLNDDIKFPVFCKPKVGYGSRGTKKINNNKELIDYSLNNRDYLILEYLEGAEYTVDCFTNRFGELLFYGVRCRSRISNGISVNTYHIDDNNLEFKSIVDKINQTLKMRGAWFVQLKRDVNGKLKLLEVAARFGGSSALHRAKGINFASLSLFDAMNCDVEIIENNYFVEMDRALDNKYKINIDFNEVFIDFDDTIILNRELYNENVMKFLFKCKNKKIKITLLSAHEGDLDGELNRFNIKFLFDRVIHINKGELKSEYIDNNKAIFIDDSFRERKDVLINKGINVFSIDMVECLL